MKVKVVTALMEDGDIAFVRVFKPSTSKKAIAKFFAKELIDGEIEGDYPMGKSLEDIGEAVGVKFEIKTEKVEG